MKLNNLPTITSSKKKRLGRGYGSGKGGHTSSRGQKGQRSRGNIALWFEGGQLPFIRRFPLQRGKGRFKSLKPQKIIINISQLSKFAPKSRVTPEALVQAGLIKEKEAKLPIKIVSSGKLNIPLEIAVPLTAKAAEKIKNAGGKITQSPLESKASMNAKHE